MLKDQEVRGYVLCDSTPTFSFSQYVGFFFLLPLQIWMLTILAAQEAASSPQSILPSGTRDLIFAYTPSSSCPWGPGGNISHLPCPLPTLQVPLMAVAAKPLSDSAKGVDIWLSAGRFSSCSHLWGKSRYWIEAICISGSDLPLDRTHWSGIDQFQEYAQCSLAEEKNVHLKQNSKIKFLKNEKIIVS